MPSAKYIGYLSGAAVAAGVGAAIAVAGPGTAHAETDGASASESSSAKSESTATRESKSSGHKDKASDRATQQAADTDSDNDTVDAGPKRTTDKDKPKFDPADAVKELTKQFGVTKPSKAEDAKAGVKDEAEDTDADEPTDATVVEEAVVKPAAPALFQPLDDLATKASEVVASLTKPLAAPTQELASTESDNSKADVQAAAGPVPWSPNPFRPMPPEPAPSDMPGLLWNVEQAVINAFQPVPFLQPFVREGYEAVFRGSQMIPFVNAIIPIVNIADQLPNLATGNPVEFRNATQRIINNLIVTLHPVSVLFYGYDQIADLTNFEFEAQQAKATFYSTTWNILDPFALLHNRGESGLPLSPSSPGATVQTPSPAVQLAAATSTAAATADEPGSSPFRAEDPDPRGMPAILIQTRNLVALVLPPELKPVFREGFELVYRVSQMVPFVNAVIPITDILPAFFQALSGDKAGAQRAVNQLLLTTGPISILYYGYDQIADLLNVEDAAFATKEDLYINLWDSIDSLGILHNIGQSGLRTA